MPYNAHNDILEAATETGIFGGILFLGFFVLLFYKLNNKLSFNTNSNYGFEFLILAPFPLIVYFVDLNLNFPSYRPFNLYLLSYIIILYNSNQRLMRDHKFIFIIYSLLFVFAAFSFYSNYKNYLAFDNQIIINNVISSGRYQDIPDFYVIEYLRLP